MYSICSQMKCSCVSDCQTVTDVSLFEIQTQIALWFDVDRV